MAENSKISWTDHTFNPWWGCVKVSPACDHCYAEGFAKRVGEKVWGIDAPRRFFGDKHWNEPLKWNRDALKDLGRPARVFCASMADVFEARPELDVHRQRLMQLVHGTPNLDWLLLTKRHTQLARYGKVFTQAGNARLGVTVESQTYDHRIVDGVSWISAEPLLGELSFRWLSVFPPPHRAQRSDSPKTDHLDGLRTLSWVIVGGESGPHAREMKLEWALNIIAECKEAGVAVHFKQTGDVLARKLGLKDRSGKNPAEWPAELRIQEFPQPAEATDAH